MATREGCEQVSDLKEESRVEPSQGDPTEPDNGAGSDLLLGEDVDGLLILNHESSSDPTSVP